MSRPQQPEQEPDYYQEELKASEKIRQLLVHVPEYARKDYLDMRDNNGHTPLMLAAMNINYGMVKALLEAGANPDIRDRHGNTALMLMCYVLKVHGQLDEAARKHKLTGHGLDFKSCKCFLEFLAVLKAQENDIKKM